MLEKMNLMKDLKQFLDKSKKTIMIIVITPEMQILKIQMEQIE